MDLKPGEEEFLRGMQAITLDSGGRQVFVGLSVEESEAFLRMTRRNEAGEDMSVDPLYQALRERHEAMRRRIVEGEASLDHPSQAR